MNRHLAVAAGLIAGTLLLCSAPASAHGSVQWSVTIGTPYYYQPPGVVVWPQTQYIYGQPPSAFAPPPAVIYVPQQPVYRVYPPPVQYYHDPFTHPHREHRDHRRHDRGWYDDRPGHFRR